MARQGILSSPDNLEQFASGMIKKFGVENVWFYEKTSIIENANDPTDVGDKIIEYIPITIAILSWNVELINNTTILQGDRKGYIAYFDGISDIKAGDYIVKKDGDTIKARLKIVVPTQPQEYKDKIVALLVNLRS